MALLDGHLLVPTTGEIRNGVGVSEVIIEPSPEWPGAADFRLSATELHEWTTGDVLQDARKASLDRTRVTPGPIVNGIRTALTYDETKWNGEVPILLVAPVLVHPDGTLQRLTFHLAARLAAKREAYMARTRAIIEGIVPGPPVPTGPATATIEDGLVIDVPKGYAYFRYIPGENQMLIEIERVHRIGEAPDGLSIHTSAAPAGTNSAVWEKAEHMLDPKGPKKRGMLLGQSVEWASGDFGDRPGGRQLEATVRRGSRKIRVTVFHYDKSSERALREIAGTLRGR